MTIQSTRSAPVPRGLASDSRGRRNSRLGQIGEEMAANHLQDLGYEVIERNWSCPLGEIDIVAQDGATLVVVEVKTRRCQNYGSAIEAVTAVKLRKLRRLITAYCQNRRIFPPSMRIDAIGVDFLATGVRIDHRRGD